MQNSARYFCAAFEKFWRLSSHTIKVVMATRMETELRVVRRMRLWPGYHLPLGCCPCGGRGGVTFSWGSNSEILIGVLTIVRPPQTVSAILSLRVASIVLARLAVKRLPAHQNATPGKGAVFAVCDLHAYNYLDRQNYRALSFLALSHGGASPCPVIRGGMFVSKAGHSR